MYRFVWLVSIMLLVLSAGCSNVSDPRISRPPAPEERVSISQDGVDYSHDLSVSRKFTVVVVGDYREYQATDLPNVSKVGTDIGREIVLNNRAVQITLQKIASAVFEETKDTGLEGAKYYDDRGDKLQEVFDENPIALLKSKLVNNTMFIVLDESSVRIRGTREPRYVVGINVHKGGSDDGGKSRVKCYLNMVEVRTGRIVGSATAAGENLQESIDKASEVFVGNVAKL